MRRMQIRFELCYAFLALLSVCCGSDESGSGDTNRCISKETCAECITGHGDCAWCTQEDYTEKGTPRCNTISNLRTQCRQIVHPKNSVEILKDLELSDTEAKEEDAVQIKPQEIKLRIKPNAPITFPIQFRQAVDYPVDLYYVMDLSNSMADDKENLEKLGGKLSLQMETITKNFRLGFGSFVDKKTAPYVNTHPQKLKEPCINKRSRIPCAAPYGFRNHMPLSLETHEFAKKVQESKVSGNLDGIEGGFDAIMQAVVCKDDIAWRNKSRKILVYTSDNGFHIAGDGKLAGLIQPNDGQCHLDANGYYTETASQDYPSLSQLNEKIKEENVIVIFAVTENQMPHYQELTKILAGSTTGKLAGDSSNIVQLIQKQYDKITSSVEITDSVKSSNNILVTYNSTCLGGKKRKTNICNGLKVGTTVTFDVTVEVTSCPSSKHEWNQTFQIFPVGLNEFVTVYLELICECDCEKPWNEEKSSSKCNQGNGTYECGVCSCYNYSYGKKCECDYRDRDPFMEDAGCIFGNDTKPCSGQGVCHCGKCHCMKRQNPDEKISGKFCQCDNYSCDKKNGKVCNDQGVCDCGKCKCHKGWSGPDCTCRENTENCIDVNGQLCNNQGQCPCGTCICNSTKEEYFMCDKCMSCEKKCDELRSCVECSMNDPDNAKNRNTNCSACNFIAHPVEDKLEVNAKEKEKLCTFEDEKRCFYTFKYKITEQNEFIVHYRTGKECPLPINMVTIISSVAGSVVGAGLLLLFLWKILTEMHDRKEFIKYKKELEKAKWDAGENPMYIPSTSTFQNPAYGQD